MLKKIAKIKDRDLYHPQRDWQIMVLITALTLALIFLLFFWLKYQINQTVSLPATATSTPFGNLTSEEINKYASEIGN